MLVVGVYVPPNYDSSTANDCLQYVNDTLIHLTRKYTDPHIMLGGDFNKKDAAKATTDLPAVKIISPQ